MACRIGITTDQQERRQYWRSRHPSLRNWRILETLFSKTSAQQAETRLSQQHGCVASPGGAGPEYATWYVYYFEY